MQVFTTIPPRGAAGPGAAALGYFDGVHLGHRAVMRAAVQAARSRGLQSQAFSFTLPAQNYKGGALLSQSEKQRRIAQTGIEAFLCPDAQDIFGLSCEEFVQNILIDALNAEWVVCGADFTFGAHAAGDVQTLRKLCAEKNITVQTVDTVQYDGQPVSSTRIRAALAQGDMPLVNALLGDTYCISFPVQEGKQFGRTMGFPTINQKFPAYMQLPKSGVYVTRTLVNGRWYPSATGLGSRPTVGGGEISCETFICGFTGNLYGQAPAVQFVRYLKPTVRFDTPAQLQQYIEDAAQTAQEEFVQPE